MQSRVWCIINIGHLIYHKSNSCFLSLLGIWIQSLISQNILSRKNITVPQRLQLTAWSCIKPKVSSIHFSNSQFWLEKMWLLNSTIQCDLKSCGLKLLLLMFLLVLIWRKPGFKSALRKRFFIFPASRLYVCFYF